MPNAPYNPAGGQIYTLSGSISSTANSFTLASFLEPVTNTPYTMALLNTQIAFGTFGPKTTSSEFISFSGITQNINGTATITGVTRGLAKKYPFTNDVAFQLPHSGQTPFILSNMPQVFQEYVSLNNDQTVGGVKTFSSSPVIPTGGTGTQAANNQDISNAITGVSGTATNLVNGTTKLSVAAVSGPNPVAVGDNDPRVPTQGENDALVGNNTDIAVGTGNKFVTQTGFQHNAEKYVADSSMSSTAYVAVLSPIPTSYTAGMVVYVKIINANTTTTPTLNVNGLGAKTIVKGVSTALAIGDIAANQFCIFQYDGTNFVLQSPFANSLTQSFAGLFKNGTTTKNAADASTTQNIAHGLAQIPKKVKVFAIFPNGPTSSSPASQATTVYNGTTQSSVSVYQVVNGGPQQNIVTTFTLNASISGGGSDTQTGVVTFDATNIIITWTKTGNPTGTYTLLWEAEA